MSDIDAVLFDVDDTLCTYRRSTGEVLEAAFEAVDVEPFFDGETYVSRFVEFAHVGEDVRDVRRAAFGTFATEADRARTVGHAVAEAYGAERDQSAVEFLPGARRAVERLTDRYRSAIVTDGDPWMQSQKLTALGIEDRFETVVHGGHDAPRKPDPEPFHTALDALGVDPERAVHVGNSLASDVAGAHAAGVRSAWLGETDRDPEPCPDYVLETMHDLTAEPWR